jgi:hypothetical protein
MMRAGFFFFMRKKLLRVLKSVAHVQRIERMRDVLSRILIGRKKSC